MTTAYGGAEKSSVELCRTIRQRYQLDVVLIVWHYGEGFDFADDHGEITIVHCHTADEYRRHVTGALSGNPGSTVVFSNHRTYAIDLRLARQAEVPCGVIFRQTPMSEESLRSLPSAESTELVYRRGHELDWLALQHAAALVGISNFGVHGIEQFAPEHSRVARIYNGLQMPGERPPVTARDVRRFLIVARLIDWKAVDFGIQAFARLASQYPDTRLQIAGNGPEATRLHQLADRLQIADKVDFLGFVNDIRSVYVNNDCLLHPCGIESFGRVVVEASLCGLPVVVTQSAGTAELVINEHTGLTFRRSDLTDCVRALERAYHLSECDYVRLASGAQQRGLAMFNPERLAQEYVGLANSMLDRSS